MPIGNEVLAAFEQIASLIDDDRLEERTYRPVHKALVGLAWTLGVAGDRLHDLADALQSGHDAERSEGVSEARLRQSALEQFGRWRSGQPCGVFEAAWE